MEHLPDNLRRLLLFWWFFVTFAGVFSPAFVAVLAAFNYKRRKKAIMLTDFN